jgi:hypothetical protein
MSKSYLPNGVKQDKQQHNQESDRAVHRTLKNNSQRFSKTPVLHPQAAVGLKADSVSPVWHRQQRSDGDAREDAGEMAPQPTKQKATASGGLMWRTGSALSA